MATSKKKSNGASARSNKVHPVSQWLDMVSTSVGNHKLWLFSERNGNRSAILDDLRNVVRGHYVDPKLMASRLKALGAPKTAKLLRKHIPSSKRARSGDLGEILATEIAEQNLHYEVPIRRLRWKDNREMALRGNDIIGIAWDKEKNLLLLKGESKSRAALSPAVLKDAGTALDSNSGWPDPNTVLFVAARLREQNKNDLAEELEDSILESFQMTPITHLLFVLTGSPPKASLVAHLKDVSKRQQVRHAVGVYVKNHQKFIDILFRRL